MSPKDKQLFVSKAAAHGHRLHRYLVARLKHAAADVPDLFQEIFLRLLRVQRPEAIRSPEAYLFTIARHVLHQYRTGRSAEPEVIDIADVLAELEESEDIGVEAQLEAQQRLAQLEYAMSQMPRKAYAALLLYRVHGLTLSQVAERLGVSRSMVKKYVAKALTHCQQSDDQE
ncbi:MAG TPA: RNA polymerase sigma factor [Steroidobacter sp.]